MDQQVCVQLASSSHKQKEAGTVDQRGFASRSGLPNLFKYQLLDGNDVTEGERVLHPLASLAFSICGFRSSLLCSA